MAESVLGPIEDAERSQIKPNEDPAALSKDCVLDSRTISMLLDAIDYAIQSAKAARKAEVSLREFNSNHGQSEQLLYEQIKSLFLTARTFARLCNRAARATLEFAKTNDLVIVYLSNPQFEDRMRFEHFWTIVEAGSCEHVPCSLEPGRGRRPTPNRRHNSNQGNSSRIGRAVSDAAGSHVKSSNSGQFLHDNNVHDKDDARVSGCRPFSSTAVPIYQVYESPSKGSTSGSAWSISNQPDVKQTTPADQSPPQKDRSSPAAGSIGPPTPKIKTSTYSQRSFSGTKMTSLYSPTPSARKLATTFHNIQNERHIEEEDEFELDLRQVAAPDRSPDSRRNAGQSTEQQRALWMQELQIMREFFLPVLAGVEDSIDNSTDCLQYIDRAPEHPSPTQGHSPPEMDLRRLSSWEFLPASGMTSQRLDSASNRRLAGYRSMLPLVESYLSTDHQLIRPYTGWRQELPNSTISHNLTEQALRRSSALFRRRQDGNQPRPNSNTIEEVDEDVFIDDDDSDDEGSEI